MDYRAFTKNLAHAGLSIRAFAELVRMNKNSITNYAQKGQVSTHLGIISQLIAALADAGVDFRKVLTNVPARPKRGRGVPFGHPRKVPATGIPCGDQNAPSAPPEKQKPLQERSPRFWYPGDLVIPDTPVHLQRSAPEMPPTKVVRVTRRGRKIPER